MLVKGATDVIAHQCPHLFFIYKFYWSGLYYRKESHSASLNQTDYHYFPTKCVCAMHTRIHYSNNECNGVSNHRRLDCLLNCLFMRRSKRTSKLRVTGLCEGNLPVLGEFPAVTGEFPSQRASNAETVSIWWRHLEYIFWINSHDNHWVHRTKNAYNQNTLIIPCRVMR